MFHFVKHFVVLLIYQKIIISLFYKIYTYLHFFILVINVSIYSFSFKVLFFIYPVTVKINTESVVFFYYWFIYFLSIISHQAFLFMLLISLCHQILINVCFYLLC
jgi:hypothetical protein